MNRGTYLILIRLSHPVRVSRPRETVLEKGVYAYVGSAMNSLTSRIKRHLTKGKKVHWHIDQLTEEGDVILFLGIIGGRLEEELSRFLAERFEVVEDFGSSDLRVKGNLFRIRDFGELWRDLMRFLEKHGDFQV